MSDNQKQQENGGNDSSKVENQFNRALRNLIALMGGEKQLKSQKIPNDAVGEVVTELLKERQEATFKLFKDKANTLLNEYATFTKECSDAEKVHQKIIVDKKKEFTKKMNDLFGTLSNVDELAKVFYQGMKEVQEAPTEDLKNEDHSLDTEEIKD